MVLTAHHIPIAKAEDHDLAEDCLNLLRDNAIEASIRTTGSPGREIYTVRVEPERFNEAYILIESKITNDGFFDIYQESSFFKHENLSSKVIGDSNFAA